MVIVAVDVEEEVIEVEGTIVVVVVDSSLLPRTLTTTMRIISSNEGQPQQQRVAGLQSTTKVHSTIPSFLSEYAPLRMLCPLVVYAFPVFF